MFYGITRFEWSVSMHLRHFVNAVHLGNLMRSLNFVSHAVVALSRRDLLRCGDRRISSS